MSMRASSASSSRSSANSAPVSSGTRVSTHVWDLPVPKRYERPVSAPNTNTGGEAAARAATVATEHARTRPQSALPTSYRVKDARYRSERVSLQSLRGNPGRNSAVVYERETLVGGAHHGWERDNDENLHPVVALQPKQPVHSRDPGVRESFIDAKPHQRSKRQRLQPPKWLRFETWWNEGTKRETRKMKLNFCVATRVFDVWVDGHPPVQVQTFGLDGAVMTEDDLWLGMTLELLGRRVTLRVAALETCQWLDARARHLCEVKARLQRELCKFVLVAPKCGPWEQKQQDTLRNPHMAMGGKMELRSLAREVDELTAHLRRFKPTEAEPDVAWVAEDPVERDQACPPATDMHTPSESCRRPPRRRDRPQSAVVPPRLPRRDRPVSAGPTHSSAWVAHMNL